MASEAACREGLIANRPADVDCDLRGFLRARHLQRYFSCSRIELCNDAKYASCLPVRQFIALLGFDIAGHPHSSVPDQAGSVRPALWREVRIETTVSATGE